jgi:hypothetical protein
VTGEPFRVRIEHLVLRANVSSGMNYVRLGGETLIWLRGSTDDEEPVLVRRRPGLPPPFWEILDGRHRFFRAVIAGRPDLLCIEALNPPREGLMKTVRTTLSALIAAAALVALAEPASAAAEKYPLTGPYANISCADLTPLDGSVDIAPGFVVFNANKNKLSAVVSVKDAPPNTQFPIRLIQGTRNDEGSIDCYTVDGILKTNAQGKGTLNVAEPVVGTRAQVVIDTTALFGTPTYRGTEMFRFAE